MLLVSHDSPHSMVITSDCACDIEMEKASFPLNDCGLRLCREVAAYAPGCKA